eukprot:TRINITY_DN64_c3_g3_i1.p1 TRINITY_DN64_c3_g3~~TRINITY_DN64_c3_g3_i1.p1  ORF type:complete len:243 (+),score=26.75 TRINITY_DN64_c3_g3_i1:54-782(+)
MLSPDESPWLENLVAYHNKHKTGASVHDVKQLLVDHNGFEEDYYKTLEAKYGERPEWPENVPQREEEDMCQGTSVQAGLLAQLAMTKSVIEDLEDQLKSNGSDEVLSLRKLLRESQERERKQIRLNNHLSERLLNLTAALRELQKQAEGSQEPESFDDVGVDEIEAPPQTRSLPSSTPEEQNEGLQEQPQPQPQPHPTPATEYKKQIESLQGMGFPIDDTLLTALRITRGNVARTVEMLLVF